MTRCLYGVEGLAEPLTPEAVSAIPSLLDESWRALLKVGECRGYRAGASFALACKTEMGERLLVKVSAVLGDPLRGPPRARIEFSIQGENPYDVVRALEALGSAARARGYSLQLSPQGRHQ